MKKLLVFKDSFAFIYLNESVYTKSNIKLALNEFKEFITPSINKIGKYNVLKIENKTNDYSLEELAYEFSNYTLSLEQNKIEQ